MKIVRFADGLTPLLGLLAAVLKGMQLDPGGIERQLESMQLDPGGRLFDTPDAETFSSCLIFRLFSSILSFRYLFFSLSRFYSFIYPPRFFSFPHAVVWARESAAPPGKAQVLFPSIVFY